jgi:diaminopimelate epimerase
MMVINFSKMHGLGNDFMVIDAINQPIDFSAEQIRRLSDRHFGIGFDQLLVVERPVSANAAFKYRIFNADGSEVAQCGNGARCFAKFVREKQLTEHAEIVVDTNAGQLVLYIDEAGWVTVNMGIPKHLPEQIPLLMPEPALLYTLTVADVEIQFAALSIGNPHAVLQVENIDEAPLETLGAILERHAVFPARCNIGFMQIADRQNIKLRVYERGAGETLACGSGACAAVIAGIEQNLLDADVRVSLPGGQLFICWQGRGHPVLMAGPASFVYEGWIEL